MAAQSLPFPGTEIAPDLREALDTDARQIICAAMLTPSVKVGKAN
jgi:hypothetical protein